MVGEMTGESATQRCPECNGETRMSDSELVCRECHTIVEEHIIDHGPDWRSLDEETSKRRTGGPRSQSRHDRGLSTKIGFGDGSEVPVERKRRFVRLRREHNRARLSSKRDRNRVYAYTEIRRIVSALSISTSIRDQSCSLFDSAQDADLLCGRSIEGFAAAVIYATCRIQSLTRSMDEIVDEARANKDELKAAYTALNRELGLPTGPIDPTDYMPRYASNLGVNANIERRAREYAVVLKNEGHVGGKNPAGVAAACLYKAAVEAGLGVTQSQAADLANVSRMTINSTVTRIENID